MAKLPDGVVTFIDDDKTSIHYHTSEIVLCKNCYYFDTETDICTSWGSWTEEKGYCYMGMERKENTDDQM